MSKFIYTTADVARITGKTRQTIDGARNGYTTVKNYVVAPRLIEGVDYILVKRAYLHSQSAIDNFLNAKAGRPKKEITENPEPKRPRGRPKKEKPS